MVDMNKLMVALLETMQGATAEINKLDKEIGSLKMDIETAQASIDRSHALIDKDAEILNSTKEYYIKVFSKEPEY